MLASALLSVVRTLVTFLSGAGPAVYSLSACLTLLVPCAPGFRAAAAEPAVKPAEVFYLNEPEFVQEYKPGKELANWVLFRELFRQALLTAARDEVGLAGRDGLLRDPAPDGLPAGNRFSLSLRLPYHRPLHLTISHGTTDGPKTLLDRDGPKDLCPQAADPQDIRRWVVETERLSRTEFVDLLRKAGFEGRPQPAGTGDVPAAVGDLLAEMNYVPQVAALRELHALARDKGLSPQVAGALSRAYANLGLLTELHWSPAHKAFKARALLYAQRLAAAAPKSPVPLWHRAYALGISGVHNEALKDLDEAAKLAMAAGTEPPAWVPLLDAFLHFDTAGLKRDPADPNLKPLAALLRFLTVESKRAPTLVVKTGVEALKVVPDCGRIHDALAETGGVAARHTFTLLSQEAFTKSWPRRLEAVPGLPDKARELLKADDAEARLVAALAETGRRAADRGEPSLAVLGYLGQEARFTQACARLHFMRDMWAVPVDEELAKDLPLVKGHPYEALVRSYGVSPTRQFPLYQKLLLNMPLRDPDARQVELLRALNRASPEQAERANVVIYATTDPTYRDLRLFANGYEDDSYEARLTSLHIYSPYSPVGRSGVLRHDENGKGWIAEAVEAWEKEAQHPDLLMALGDYYTKGKKTEAAERCLRRAVELSPDTTTLRALAKSYRSRGKTKQWLETLEAVLETEDVGLEHAQVRVEIARHHMAEKDFKRALPYAEAAAETWAGWAMQCASQCNEGLGDWERAELWVRRISERYPDSVEDWFLWCHRTGKGDAAAADKLLREYLDEQGEQKDASDVLRVAERHLLGGEPAKAAEAFEHYFRRDPKNDFACVQAALCYDRAGKADRRDALLRSLPKESSFAPLVKLFRDALGRAKSDWLDAKELEGVIRAADERSQGAFCYWAGCFLDQRGQHEAAVGYWKRAVDHFGTHDSFIPADAAAALRSRHDGKGK